MKMPLSERRQIENEMIFRSDNEKVGDSLNELDAQLIEDNYPELTSTESMLLHFKCECSDENCDERIPMELSKYQKLHQNRKAFIVKPNHQVNEIEKVIIAESNYSVVEKNKIISNPGSSLNETSVDNS